MKAAVRNIVQTVARRLPVTRAVYAENDVLKHALQNVSKVQQELLFDGGRMRQASAGMPPDFDMIVPVFNAAKWLETILSGYDALKLHPLFIVDEASSDASLEMLRARKVRMIVVPSGRVPTAEALLFPILPNLKSKYILRLDDDELPSASLISWIRDHFDEFAEPAIGLPRHWVAHSPSREWMMTSGIDGQGMLGADYQYRLFQPGRVKPVGNLHSPGFELQTFRKAPLDAAIYHFDWVVRDYQTRQLKVAAYNGICVGAGKKTAHFYLPEDRGFGDYGLRSLRDPLIIDACQKLAT